MAAVGHRADIIGPQRSRGGNGQRVRGAAARPRGQTADRPCKGKGNIIPVTIARIGREMKCRNGGSGRGTPLVIDRVEERDILGRGNGRGGG